MKSKLKWIQSKTILPNEYENIEIVDEIKIFKELKIFYQKLYEKKLLKSETDINTFLELKHQSYLTHK